MIKYIIIVLNFIFVFFPGIFQQDEVEFRIAAPDSITAGEPAEITVTIQKGSLRGFARFQHELPSGLTATAIQKGNADFSVEKGKVRFIWLNLPEEEKIVLKYTLQAHERLKGSFDLQGEFSYIRDNERNRLEAMAGTVNIKPNPAVVPDLLVDLADFDAVFGTPGPASLATALCIREVPYIIEGSEDIIVNLLVYKNGFSKFARIEEKVPAGFRAVEKITENGVFTFQSGIAKFLWMQLPEEDFFTVQYALRPEEGQGTTHLDLEGTFSYVTDGRTRTLEILEDDAPVAEMNQVKVLALVEEKRDQINETKSISERDASLSLVADREQQSRDSIRVEKPVTTPVTTPATMSFNPQYRIPVESGVHYRVQVAAGHKPVNIPSYFGEYNLQHDVKVEAHQGWLKYSSGTFQVYRAARDYRNLVWHNTSIDGAFVTSYNNGERITVQEALMITNQQWFK